MACAVKSCKCKHDYQDRVYGHGKRLHNSLKKKADRPQEYRCTVCGSVKV